MYLSEELQSKWQPVLEHPELDAIKDPYKKAVTAMILENQQKAILQERMQLNETDAGPTNVTGGVKNYDPILISLVRRALPNLIAYDVAGVQPMTGPTGLIFAMRARYDDQSGSEAFFNEANTIFSGNTSTNNLYGFGGNTISDTATSAVANFTFLAVLPIVCISDVSLRRNPSLSASRIATSDTSGKSSPSRRRLMPTSTSNSPLRSERKISTRSIASISLWRYWTLTPMPRR